MNKRNSLAKSKSKLVYAEVTQQKDGDGKGKKAENYDFTAKFKKGREDPSVGSKHSGSDKGSETEITSLRESLVVENNPQKVNLAKKITPDYWYKIFVKSYLIDSKLICPFLVAVILVFALLALGIWSNISMNQIVQFSIPYSSMFFKKMCAVFSWNMLDSSYFFECHFGKIDIFIFASVELVSNNSRVCQFF